MSTFAQWTGVLGAPLVWLAYLQTNYALASAACHDGNKTPLVVVTVLALLATIGMIFLAWRIWRSAGQTADTEAGGTPGRSRFMALLGLGNSVLFALVILAGIVPLAFLGVCD
jgi:TRAP-type C4-dicarboxylate transport system permease small subunit